MTSTAYRLSDDESNAAAQAGAAAWAAGQSCDPPLEIINRGRAEAWRSGWITQAEQFNKSGWATPQAQDAVERALEASLRIAKRFAKRKLPLGQKQQNQSDFTDLTRAIQIVAPDLLPQRRKATRGPR